MADLGLGRDARFYEELGTKEDVQRLLDSQFVQEKLQGIKSVMAMAALGRDIAEVGVLGPVTSSPVSCAWSLAAALGATPPQHTPGQLTSPTTRWLLRRRGEERLGAEPRAQEAHLHVPRAPCRRPARPRAAVGQLVPARPLGPEPADPLAGAARHVLHPAADHPADRPHGRAKVRQGRLGARRLGARAQDSRLGATQAHAGARQRGGSGGRGGGPGGGEPRARGGAGGAAAAPWRYEPERTLGRRLCFHGAVPEPARLAAHALPPHGAHPPPDPRVKPVTTRRQARSPNSARLWPYRCARSPTWTSGASRCCSTSCSATAARTSQTPTAPRRAAAAAAGPQRR
eukprot:scaffold66041_cov61-Phaeocystis_antarctica.AAC.1